MTALSRPEGAADESVAVFVGALDEAQALLRRVSDRALSELGGGITTTQLRLLDRLERLGESRLIDLADALSIAPSTATRLCDALAERQLIVRHRRGRDRRELQIRLTDAGNRLLGAIRERTATDWEQLFARVPAVTRGRVVTVLERLVEDRSASAALVSAADISA
ncbi:MAG: MarR family winged helix-turn-helix transcriptional regulator [Acidimicrobiales bacterium]